MRRLNGIRGMLGKSNLRRARTLKERELMKLRTLCLFLGAGLLTGCWQKSLNAFYMSGDVITEPKIVGTWQQVDEKGEREKGQVWTFAQGAEKGYGSDTPTKMKSCVMKRAFSC